MEEEWDDFAWASHVPGTINDDGEDADGVFPPFYSLHLVIIFFLHLLFIISLF